MLLLHGTRFTDGCQRWCVRPVVPVVRRHISIVGTDRPAVVNRLSMADEISPEVADENSPLRCGLVASVSAWRLDVSEVCEVEIDDGLQGFAGRGLAECVRQGVGPGGVIGL